MNQIDFIREANYKVDMENIVLPYLLQRKKSGDFERVPGHKIHYRTYAADTPHADVVLVHGFTEGLDKFNEVVYYFLQTGYNVWQIQQMGHGKSYRLVKDPSLVYIKDYRDLIRDLHSFVTDIVEKQRKNPLLPKYIFGHSMGGGVSAAYIEMYPDDFSKAVLTSPMLELNSGNNSVLAVALYAQFMNMAGRGKNYLPGSAPFSPKPDFENSCSNSKARYENWFAQVCQREEYQTCASAITTAMEFLKLIKYATAKKNCARVKAKVLLIQAGNDNMVKPGGQETFICQIGELGRIFRMENAKHEIYLGKDSDLEVYWKEILEFLQ